MTCIPESVHTDVVGASCPPGLVTKFFDALSMSRSSQRDTRAQADIVALLSLDFFGL